MHFFHWIFDFVISRFDFSGIDILFARRINHSKQIYHKWNENGCHGWVALHIRAYDDIKQIRCSQSHSEAIRKKNQQNAITFLLLRETKNHIKIFGVARTHFAHGFARVRLHTCQFCFRFTPAIYFTYIYVFAYLIYLIKMWSEKIISYPDSHCSILRLSWISYIYILFLVACCLSR